MVMMYNRFEVIREVVEGVELDKLVENILVMVNVVEEEFKFLERRKFIKVFFIFVFLLKRIFL